MNTLTCITEIKETPFNRIDVCVRNITPVIRDAQIAYPEDYVNGWCVTQLKSDSI